MTRVIVLAAIAAVLLTGCQAQTCHAAHRAIHVNGQTEKYPEANCEHA